MNNTVNDEEVVWTEDWFKEFNERCKRVGFPPVIIENGYVYKDELHKFLGIGVKL